MLYPGVRVTASTSVVPTAPPDGEVLRYSFQRARSLVDAFWKRWSKEYVATLRNRSKWCKTRPDLKEGQLVLLVDEVMARDAWKLGRIVSVSGDESHIRTVEVMAGAPSKKVFRRDITKVVPLEVD